MRGGNASPFELDEFVADCRTALQDVSPTRAMREIVARAVSEPAAVLRSLGEPERAGIQRLHVSSDLTILNVVWAPHMSLMPHDHRMWAVIGMYVGGEDNVFWRRLEDEPDGRVEAAGARSIAATDVIPLGPEIIHSVTNPAPRFSGAIHVYGGDFFSVPRSQWDPETLLEEPYSAETILRVFEEANRCRSAPDGDPIAPV
jgi:predicted metal-dependent enzyme (double-stranded beta helix superfamily)